MSKRSNIVIGLVLLVTLVFLYVKTSLIVSFWYLSPLILTTEYACFSVLITSFYFIIIDLFKKNKQFIKENKYYDSLNNSLINQSRNDFFYLGNILDASKFITKEITEVIYADRASVWFYSKDKKSILCQQLYIKSEEKFYDNIVLHEKDYPSYFKALLDNPIIIADFADSHYATSCFKETYLNPLGIKSMLDVPIWHKEEILGVICIESLSQRKWKRSEINFAQIISSLYSFGYSVNESNSLSEQMIENEKFLDASSIISFANKKGKITYANKRFTDISGYSLEEVIGKDHNIVNSGVHSKDFWANMYKTVIADKKIWNEICTNRSKNGNLYYVDTFIKAKFDKNGNLEGFASIRQDVTDIKIKETEIRNRMNAINKSNAVIEFDLNGRIMFANPIFCNILGYTEKELIGRYHKIFVGEEFLFSNSRSKEYKDFWKKLKNGEFVTSEFQRFTKNGDTVWLKASYNPILGTDGSPYRIMKIATDITEMYNQQKEIEKKNTYLEHAAKIIRHDMHSGINTYIPRGLSSLTRRITEDQIKDLKIDAPIKMIKEGLRHTQKVYKGVYEFTNLVKKDAVLNKEICELSKILDDYLSSTAYRSQVIIDDLGTLSVNDSLFCTAIDNLIRNGLKYNDSPSKVVNITRDKEFIYIEDNGRGMTQEEFKILSKPYTRKSGQAETGTGLGLNICIAILEEHGFKVECDKLKKGGTQIKIKIKND